MRQRDNRPGGLVYSTEHGRMCPGCSAPVERCTCAPAAAGPAGDGVVRVSYETSGRKGRKVTVITGVALARDELAALATTLKKLCGSGGTVKDGRIEIQGEHGDALRTALGQRGFNVK